MFIDQYDDVNNEYLEKLANAGIIINKRDDVHELEDKDFAVIIVKKRPHRKYPIADRSSTMLSMLYFLKNMGELPDEVREVAGARIKEAAIKFDIDVPSKLDQFDIGADDYIVKEEEIVKEASVSDDMFGLVYEENGEKIRKFPMPDEHHVKLAEMYVDEAPARFQDQIKEKIDEKKTEYGMEEEIKLNPNIDRDMRFRVKELPTDAQKPYFKLVEKLKNGDVTIAEARKVIEKLDKEQGIEPRKMPADEVLMDIEKKRKVANDFTALFEMEKTAEPSHQVIRAFQNDDEKRNLLTKKLKENFDEGLVNDLMEDPETIYESLPDPHQNMVDRIIREAKNNV